ncbi:MAG: ASCH domain-containing protein [Desulfurivibrionaceae bacterium]|jgi:hypothetical protein
MMDLILPVKGVYFAQIAAGLKPEEYRLRSAYWCRRIEGKVFDRVIVTWGYPKSTDSDRRLVLPWQGCTVKTITHPHFGPEPVEVFAIDVRPKD